MTNPEIFSSTGDVDELLGSGDERGSATNIDASAENSGNESVESVDSDNQIGPNSLVGDVDVTGLAGDVTGASNSGDVNTGNLTGNGVTDVVGGVQGGDVMGSVEDVTGGLSGDLGGVTSDLGDVTSSTGDVEPAQELSGQNELVGSQGPVGTVADTASGATGMVDDVTGGLGL
ncbi:MULTISPECIES: hypothetical protein [unclassified Actinopolyspora]|uniref:hypothetical protein n=1 Tax=unclassified Actinopolyspora TaxID=2639451 RepID=UPI0013F5C3E4|nr:MULTISPECIES: hypothetical protein [unclassified Actinopolyspora]NHD18050.1 hypothetical protein [Actinopolyspora sp. BKK2]NHE78627.1 hypothetical protein [Actinopolyspora sp. BKK1]